VRVATTETRGHFRILLGSQEKAVTVVKGHQQRNDSPFFVCVKKMYRATGTLITDQHDVDPKPWLLNDRSVLTASHSRDSARKIHQMPPKSGAPQSAALAHGAGPS
jgi:hypothetical protein